MKKILLCIAVAVFSFSGISAQGTKFGVKGGLNLSTLSGDNTEDLKMRMAYHAGAAVEIGLSEKFALQPEFIYSAQGAVVDTPDEPVREYDYINVPLMGKLFVSDGFSIEFGPQIGFNIKSQRKLDGVELEEEVKNIDYGANFGLGYKLEGGLFFNARYNLGLSNINDVSGDDTEIKNGVIQFSVGYFF